MEDNVLFCRNSSAPLIEPQSACNVRVGTRIGDLDLDILSPVQCPHCRRKVRQSHISATVWTGYYSAEANTQMGRRMHQNTQFET